MRAVWSSLAVTTVWPSRLKAADVTQLVWPWRVARGRRWRLRKRLEMHLTLLRRQGLIQEWHDRKIDAGPRMGRGDRREPGSVAHHSAAHQRQLPRLRLLLRPGDEARAGTARTWRGARHPDHPSPRRLDGSTVRPASGTADEREAGDRLVR